MKIGKIGLTVASMALLAVVLAGCGGPKTASISATMEEFSYTPNAWSVPAGAEVTLTLTNKGSVEHEWVIFEKGYTVVLPFGDKDESHIIWEAEADAGATKTFTFTAPTDPGTYNIGCGLPGHMEGGMVGTLTVTP